MLTDIRGRDLMRPHIREQIGRRICTDLPPFQHIQDNLALDRENGGAPPFDPFLPKIEPQKTMVHILDVTEGWWQFGDETHVLSLRKIAMFLEEELNKEFHTQNVLDIDIEKLERLGFTRERVWPSFSVEYRKRQDSPQQASSRKSRVCRQPKGSSTKAKRHACGPTCIKLELDEKTAKQMEKHAKSERGRRCICREIYKQLGEWCGDFVCDLATQYTPHLIDQLRAKIDEKEHSGEANVKKRGGKRCGMRAGTIGKDHVHVRVLLGTILQGMINLLCRYARQKRDHDHRIQLEERDHYYQMQLEQREYYYRVQLEERDQYYQTQLKESEYYHHTQLEELRAQLNQLKVSVRPHCLTPSTSDDEEASSPTSAYSALTLQPHCQW